MKHVGILRGGAGENYHSSLQKGADIISHISESLPHKYKVFDILVDKENVWHINGVPVMPADLAHKVDVVWNTSYPHISVALDNLSIPNVSHHSFSSTLENSKEMLREHMKSIGVNIPRHIILPVYQKDFDGSREKYAVKKAKEIFEKFSSPWLVKSLTPSARMGVHLAKTFPKLIKAIEDGLEHETSILVEEFIVGKVASVHSLAGFRGENIYTFPVMKVFGDFSLDEKEKLQNLARDLHNNLGAKHYLKLNFILNKRGKIYLANVKSIPDFNPDSHYFSRICESVGAKTHHIIEHILEQVPR